MPRRPAIRKSDLSATLAAMMAAGLKPGAVRYFPDGGFKVECGDAPVAANDHLDAELAAFEARHGQD